MSALAGPRPIRVLASPAATGTDGNPYIDLLYEGVRARGLEVREFDRRRLLGRRQVVHVHWPAALVRWDSGRHAALDVVKVLGGLAFARIRGSKLVWTAHDLAPHEIRRPRLLRLYLALFTQMVDLWISLTPAGRTLLEERYPALRSRPVRVIAHGSYGPAYPRQGTREDADRRLQLTAGGRGASILLLGQIRRYKNALPLLQAFLHESSDEGRLLIVGEPRGDARLADELRSAAAGRSEVVLRLGRVPSDQIASWHAAADVVVLPYDASSALNSGALMLALTLGIPVVAVDSPINRELRAAVGDQWVRLYCGDAAAALTAARGLAAQARADRPDLSSFAWPAIVAATVDTYGHLAGVTP